MWNFSAELAKWGPSRKFPTLSVQLAKQYCAHITRKHYENFTVASKFLPRRLIPHFQAVYSYCRWADDLADETGREALDLLAWWRGELLACFEGRPRHPVFVALSGTIQRFSIPREPFLNLLTAFEQDQWVTAYATFDELLGYCRNSANPVGHLVLYLFECFSPEHAKLSDEVCTGLQLANFWQDVARDAAIGRTYLPDHDRLRFGYSDDDLRAGRFTPAFAELLRFQVDRTRGYFDRGAALLPLLPPSARLDVDLFISGGRAILAAIERQRYDVWSSRPEVGKWEKIGLMAGAVGSMIRKCFKD